MTSTAPEPETIPTGDDETIPGSPLTNRQVRYLKYVIAGMTALIVILMIAIGVRMAQIAGRMIAKTPEEATVQADSSDTTGSAGTDVGAGLREVRINPALAADTSVIAISPAGAHLDVAVRRRDGSVAVLTIERETGRTLRTLVLRTGSEPGTANPPAVSAE